MLRRDVHFAWRTFRKNPGFLLASLAPLALGIGAATALFSVIHAVLLDPYPYEGADRLFTNFLLDKAGQPHGVFLNAKQLVDLQKSDVLDGAFALDTWNMNLTGGDFPETLKANYYSANALTLLGISPMLGRIFTAADGPPGEEASRVVVLTHRFWKDHFGGDKSLIGKMLQLNRQPYTVIGVVGPQFDSSFGDVIIPIDLKSDSHFAWGVEARLKRGVPRDTANARLLQLLQQFAIESPNRFPSEFRVKVSTLEERRRTAAYVPTLILLLAAASTLMLVACLNVSILLLARGTSRTQELAIRHAIGASGSQLLGQLLTESLCLAIAGSTLGAGVAYGSVRTMLKWLPPGTLPLPLAGEAVHVNGAVLLFSVAAAILTALVFGLWPAWAYSQSPIETVRSTRSQHPYHVLVAVQVTLTVLLLVGSGAAIRGLLKLYRTELGYDPHNVLTATVNLPENSYTQWTARSNLFDSIQRRISTIPGVDSVGLGVYDGPPPRTGERSPIELPGNGSSPDRKDFVRVVRASAEYFQTLRIAMIRGSAWSSSGMLPPEHAAVINQTMARHFWPDEDPIGKHVRLASFASTTSQFVLAAPGSDGLFEIIGVVRDVPNDGLRQPPAPLMYVPYTLMLGDSATLVIRTAGDLLAMTRAIQEKVRDIDPNQPLTGIRTAEAVLGNQGWAQERFVAALLGGFASLSLIVACAGLYSVVSYAVSRRMKEFGIRMALGARLSDIIVEAVRIPVMAVLLGLGAGIVLSIALDQVISSWSFGNARDPIVIAATSALLLAITVVALVMGVRRTTSVDSLAALRSE